MMGGRIDVVAYLDLDVSWAKVGVKVALVALLRFTQGLYHGWDQGAQPCHEIAFASQMRAVA